jgi:hypothetical protein
MKSASSKSKHYLRWMLPRGIAAFVSRDECNKYSVT